MDYKPKFTIGDVALLALGLTLIVICALPKLLHRAMTCGVGLHDWPHEPRRSTIQFLNQRCKRCKRLFRETF